MKKQKSSSKPTQSEREWSGEEFVAYMDDVMKEQEKTSPLVKNTHAKFSTEWKKASGLLADVLAAQNEDVLGRKIDELCACGEHGVRVCVEFILALKRK